jgi:hypothetical protein
MVVTSFVWETTMSVGVPRLHTCGRREDSFDRRDEEKISFLSFSLLSKGVEDLT